MVHQSFFIIDFPKLVSFWPLIAIELAMAFTSRVPSVEEIGDQVFNARSTMASRSS